MKNAQRGRGAARDRPRRAGARRSRRTSAVTRGCWPWRSAAMPPTHISQTSSSRAISSVHGIGWWNRWRPTTCRPTTSACAATSTAMAPVQPAIGAVARAGADRRRVRGIVHDIVNVGDAHARITPSQSSTPSARAFGLPEPLGGAPQRRVVDVADRHAALARAASWRRHPPTAPSPAAAGAASSADRSRIARMSAGSLRHASRSTPTGRARRRCAACCAM